MTAIYVIHSHDARNEFELLEKGAAARTRIVAAITGGHITGTIDRVDCYDTDEHVADDVSEDIAIEIANGVDAWDSITPQVRSFIETHAGLDYARGLRVADPTFAAA